jgi:hypothetical protein
MTEFDARDPDLLRWLASLTAERELVMRMAMRHVFDRARGDPAWKRRIDELTAEIKPSERKLAELLKEVEKAVDMINDVDAAARVDESILPE